MNVYRVNWREYSAGPLEIDHESGGLSHTDRHDGTLVPASSMLLARQTHQLAWPSREIISVVLIAKDVL